MGDLTIKQAQERHPWNTLNGGYGAVPYSEGVREAERSDVPHIQGSHAVLHAAKSVGKLAAIFEDLDHKPTDFSKHLPLGYRRSIADMAADMATAALRLAHLYGFDLAEALESRAKEKNGVGFEVKP